MRNRTAKTESECRSDRSKFEEVLKGGVKTFSHLWGDAKRLEVVKKFAVLDKNFALFTYFDRHSVHDL